MFTKLGKICKFNFNAVRTVKEKKFYLISNGYIVYIMQWQAYQFSL